ncbi:MAG: hypothetical protein V2B18_10515 [Pseudomonadota bacterium]
MTTDQEYLVSPELSMEFQSFEEFCSDNTGQELTYLEMVSTDPLEMDPVTLAFSVRRLVRLSRDLLDLLLESLAEEFPPEPERIWEVKGIQLDKSRSDTLRPILFSFRDCADPEVAGRLSKALQLLAISRERKKVTLQLGEAYNNPEEGWTLEDFGGDESLLETVRSVEDPYWVESEED